VKTLALREKVQDLRNRIQDMVAEGRGAKEDALKSAKVLRPKPLRNILQRRLRKRE